MAFCFPNPKDGSRSLGLFCNRQTLCLISEKKYCVALDYLRAICEGFTL